MSLGRFRIVFVFVVAALMAGCASAPVPNLPHPTREFPADAFITTRGVLTARGRQFSLNGYLARSATGGQRLIMTENFGNVMADVLVKPDGTAHVMRAGTVFKPKWIERYVAGDLKCIFGGGDADPKCPGRMLGPTHFTIEHFWYKLDLQIVDIKPGPQSPALFEEKSAKTP